MLKNNFSKIPKKKKFELGIVDFWKIAHLENSIDQNLRKYMSRKFCFYTYHHHSVANSLKLIWKQDKVFSKRRSDFIRKVSFTERFSGFFESITSPRNETAVRRGPHSPWKWTVDVLRHFVQGDLIWISFFLALSLMFLMTMVTVSLNSTNFSKLSSKIDLPWPPMNHNEVVYDGAFTSGSWVRSKGQFQGELFP